MERIAFSASCLIRGLRWSSTSLAKRDLSPGWSLETRCHTLRFQDGKNSTTWFSITLSHSRAGHSAQLRNRQSQHLRVAAAPYTTYCYIPLRKTFHLCEN